MLFGDRATSAMLQNHQNHMHKKLSFWLALAGMVMAVSLLLRLKKPDPVAAEVSPVAPVAPAAPVAPPAAGLSSDTIGARGLIESAEENVRIASPLPGLVVNVPVKVGAKVEAGELLVQIDDRDTKSLIEQQQATLAVQEAKLKAADVNFADRREQLQRTEQLRRDNSSSESEVQRARFAVQAAEAGVLQARAEIESTKAQIGRAKVQLDMLSVRAPRAGTILQVNTRAGESATPQIAGEPLMLLGSIERLQIRAEVDEASAARVRAEAKAVAYMKGQRIDPIVLKCVRIEPFIVSRKSLPGDVGGSAETRVLQVIFSFAAPDAGKLYVGQQMDVFIDGAK